LNTQIKEAGGVGVQQAIVIRWVSLINSLESINTSFIQIRNVLISRKQQHRLSGINQYLVKQIIRLLKPFQSIIKMVQSGSKSTLYLVLPCTSSLRKALKSFDNLSQHIRLDEGQDSSESFDDEQEDEGKTIVKRIILTYNCFFRCKLYSSTNISLVI
jgi:hypothetical protein